ncbi:hypothetical protein GC722_05270 [Auraticoccus sp. F435]|uniref:Uncharacterized protein n=1 Tax=Auraticoccus cholistanensis TaxID=2656650 RepID=A0A6A9V0H9_9ACTN|nr:hypothetical protein [Auraticoccus cholistanensis]MVA75440.1 hypothetical protein [Auraticoccus cholistanensis]
MSAGAAGTAVPWRRLAVRCSVAAAAVVAGGLVLQLVGVGLRLPFLVTLVVAAVAAGWLTSVVRPAVDPPPSPEPDPPGVVTRELDRRVRVLEKHLWGVQPQHGMNRAEVQQTVARVAEARRPRDAPLPPALATYLSSEPPPTLTRRQLRALLEELNRL